MRAGTYGVIHRYFIFLVVIYYGLHRNMKQRSYIIVIMVVMLAVVFGNDQIRKRKSKRAALLEDAKRDFGRSTPFDSAYAIGDTVLFYKGDAYVGKSIIVSD